MTLNEAIEHATEKARDKKCSKDCREDHAQLAGWLKELKRFRDSMPKPPVKHYSWNDTHPNYDGVLRSRKVGCGSFATVFQYTDDDGKRHWKTGWYSNRSNYTDDFENGIFHGGVQQ